MKPLWITFIAGFIILFSFQNCQQPPHLDEINAISSNGQIISNGNKVTLSDHQIKNLQLFSKVQETIIKNGNRFSMILNRKYDFVFEGSILRSEFKVSSENSDLVEILCLTSELKNELQSILASSSICKKTDDTQDPNLICAAVILPAYATLQTEVEAYDLGAATNSCGSNSVDLCDSEASLLKGFTKHLDSQLQNLKCN